MGSGRSGDISIAEAAAQFEALGWFLPAYISLGPLRQLANGLSKLPEVDRVPALDAVLPSFYQPEDTAAMLLHRYAVVPHIKDEATRIEEALVAFYGGRYTAATCTLLPAVEAVLRAASSSFVPDPNAIRGKKFLEVIGNMLDAEAQGGDQGSEERVTILRGISKFLRGHLYLDTRVGVSPHVSRHVLMHAFPGDGSRGTAAGFCRVLSVLDTLCFTVSVLQRAPVSCLSPTRTAESKQMAGYFAAHAELALLRPSV